MKSQDFNKNLMKRFYEAWDRFNDLLRGCPHHGFSELHQLDTFYNALNSNDQDSLNSAAGWPLFSKSEVQFSDPSVSSVVAELKDMVRALILDKKNQTPAPAPVKAVEQSCVNFRVGVILTILPAPMAQMYRANIQEFVSEAACSLTTTMVDVIDIACEEYVQEVLEISKSGNPTSDLMIDSRSPSFTSLGGNSPATFRSRLTHLIREDYFTCPYGSFSSRRHAYWVTSAMHRARAIGVWLQSFNDMVEKTMEVLHSVDGGCGNVSTLGGKNALYGQEGIVLAIRILNPGIENASEAFETLKMKVIHQAPILVAPDWDLPFEIMCDASDFAVGAVLGQLQDFPDCEDSRALSFVFRVSHPQLHFGNPIS
ncbi:reverse transcriptase domain-containing protein [Tanacetum coccineum]